MTTQATQEIDFADATPLTVTYGKLVSIGDGSTGKRDSKTDFRTSVVGRLTGIRKDENYSTADKTRRLYDLVLDGGEVVTVTDAAALKAITSDTIGSVIRIAFTGYGKAKAGQSAPKQIEVKARPWDSLTDEEKARFQPIVTGDANEDGLD
jgi:hypothetical protein